ncbi:MAG: UbiA family prenyltransferase [Deltaproteobacteria bacterium]|nr:UbiA family prenyltransferase [Deltaproteobacteria bacterium]
MSGITNAFRIAFESFGYRLKKREANNFLVAASMLVAFNMPWADAALRVAFALLLNMTIYLINDVCDVEVDQASPGKDQGRVAFRAKHPGAAWAALSTESALLAGLALWHTLLFESWLLPAAWVINIILIFAYSRWLKRVPVLDVVLMAAAGASTTMVGVPHRPLGYKLLGLFALLCAAYQVIQVVRDLLEDQKNNVRTTAVLLGEGGSRLFFSAIVLSAAVYGVLSIGSLVPLALALGVFFPLNVKHAGRSWDLARALFGFVWLGLLAQIFLNHLQ